MIHLTETPMLLVVLLYLPMVGSPLLRHRLNAMVGAEKFVFDVMRYSKVPSI